jgi:23S rRNA (adenine2503-C2)-methyltransferase
VSLAISLHAPNDELRNQLVPINRKYPLVDFIDSAKRYLDKMPDNRRKVTVEYTLMDLVNDRDEHAKELSVLLRDLPCKINLIPFNPFPGSEYKRVTKVRVRRYYGR